MCSSERGPAGAARAEHARPSTRAWSTKLVASNPTAVDRAPRLRSARMTNLTPISTPEAAEALAARVAEIERGGRRRPACRCSRQRCGNFARRRAGAGGDALARRRRRRCGGAGHRPRASSCDADDRRHRSASTARGVKCSASRCRTRGAAVEPPRRGFARAADAVQIARHSRAAARGRRAPRRRRRSTSTAQAIYALAGRGRASCSTPAPRARHRRRRSSWFRRAVCGVGGVRLSWRRRTPSAPARREARARREPPTTSAGDPTVARHALRSAPPSSKPPSSAPPAPSLGDPGARARGGAAARDGRRAALEAGGRQGSTRGALAQHAGGTMRNNERARVAVAPRGQRRCAAPRAVPPTTVVAALACVERTSSPRSCRRRRLQLADARSRLVNDDAARRCGARPRSADRQRVVARACAERAPRPRSPTTRRRRRRRCRSCSAQQYSSLRRVDLAGRWCSAASPRRAAGQDGRTPPPLHVHAGGADCRRPTTTAPPRARVAGAVGSAMRAHQEDAGHGSSSVFNRAAPAASSATASTRAGSRAGAGRRPVRLAGATPTIKEKAWVGHDRPRQHMIEQTSGIKPRRRGEARLHEPQGRILLGFVAAQMSADGRGRQDQEAEGGRKQAGGGRPIYVFDLS